MATTYMNQPRDFTKPCCTENNQSVTDNINEHKKRPISSDDTPQEEKHTQASFSMVEVKPIKDFRVRSFSHWPHLLPSAESMIMAGWFSCNVGDRVICIYCNKICQNWTADDNPIEIHKELSPQCSFVRSMNPAKKPPKVINDTLSEKFQPCNPAMAEISRRQATFSQANWPESSPSVDDLVRAGFYATNIANTVTCFYCNGSLHKWGSNDNPMIEHARWFPQCTYAKHLCGEQLYKKIQSSKKRITKPSPLNARELSTLVAARLDLPEAQRLASKYKPSIIKRCIEDQLRIKNDDFPCESDLSMACSILQKQIDHIQGCQDNIIVPSKYLQTQNNSSSSSSSSKQSLGDCLICLTDEKQLACMPCGHLCACVPCGYSLKSCPVCRQKIESFMRINS